MADQWFRLPANWAIQDDWLQEIGTIPRLLWPILLAYIKGSGTGAVFSRPAPRVIAMQAGEGVTAAHVAELWDAAVQAGKIAPDGEQWRLTDRELVMSQDAIRKEEARAAAKVRTRHIEPEGTENRAETTGPVRTCPDESGQNRSTGHGQDKTYSLERRESVEGEVLEGEHAPPALAHALPPEWLALPEPDRERVLAATRPFAEVLNSRGQPCYALDDFDTMPETLLAWQQKGLLPDGQKQLADEWRAWHLAEDRKPYDLPAVQLRGRWLTNALTAQGSRARGMADTRRYAQKPNMPERAQGIAAAVDRMGGQA